MLDIFQGLLVNSGKVHGKVANRLSRRLCGRPFPISHHRVAGASCRWTPMLSQHPRALWKHVGPKASVHCFIVCVKYQVVTCGLGPPHPVLLEQVGTCLYIQGYHDLRIHTFLSRIKYCPVAWSFVLRVWQYVLIEKIGLIASRLGASNSDEMEATLSQNI